jgi:TonB family protein
VKRVLVVLILAAVSSRAGAQQTGVDSSNKVRKEQNSPVELCVVVRGAPQPESEDTIFDFFDKQPSAFADNQSPRYPDALRSANVEGEVLAMFVLDTNGCADMKTLKVLKSTHDLFTEAVKIALPRMKFYPAEVGGKKVKIRMAMPFRFSLTKGLIGTGRSSGIDSVTRGGIQANYPPTPIKLFIPPLPIPERVRGFHLVAEYDVDEAGRIVNFKFTPTPDRGYNRRLEEMLKEFKFRPGTTPDGTPIRAKAQVVYDFR